MSTVASPVISACYNEYNNKFKSTYLQTVTYIASCMYSYIEISKLTVLKTQQLYFIPYNAAITSAY